jgi:hypothetical protein
MRRRYSARIVNSGSIEEEKKKEEFLINQIQATLRQMKR